MRRNCGRSPIFMMTDRWRTPSPERTACGRQPLCRARQETFRLCACAAERLARQAHSAAPTPGPCPASAPTPTPVRSTSERGDSEPCAAACWTIVVSSGGDALPDDAFLTTMPSPAAPVAGLPDVRWEMKQPAFVEQSPRSLRGPCSVRCCWTIFECGGLRIYSTRSCWRSIARAADIRARLLPMPFAAWHALSGSRHGCRVHHAQSGGSGQRGCRAAGFAELGIALPVERVLEAMLRGPLTGCSLDSSWWPRIWGARTSWLRGQACRRAGCGGAAPASWQVRVGDFCSRFVLLFAKMAYEGRRPSRRIVHPDSHIALVLIPVSPYVPSASFQGIIEPRCRHRNTSAMSLMLPGRPRARL